MSAQSVSRLSEVALGMAQLAFRGLSEDWWLKYLGDVHWQMIATAMGQEEPVFRDAQGRPVYAAFCATHFEQALPAAAKLGAGVTVRSSLWQAGRNRLQSIHQVLSADRLLLRLRMITTFVTHGTAGVNKSVLRVPPAIIPLLPPAPDDLARVTARRARVMRQYLAGPDCVPAKSEAVPYHPNRDTDFNAAGLLYFPSYSRITALAEPPGAGGVLRERLMLYFGNNEIGEGLCAQILTSEATDEGMAHCISILDQSGAPLAVSNTVRSTS